MLLKPEKLPPLPLVIGSSALSIQLWNYSKGWLNKAYAPISNKWVLWVNFIQISESKYTDDHLFRLSGPNLSWKDFNRGEQVVATFLDVEKAFDNACYNGLRYKIIMLDLPIKISNFLV